MFAYKLSAHTDLISVLYEKTNEDNMLDVSDTLLDDLNTPGFIAKIHELYNSAYNGDKESKSSFNTACRLIGLFNISKDKWENYKKSNIKISQDHISKKIAERTEAKKDAARPFGRGNGH